MIVAVNQEIYVEIVCDIETMKTEIVPDVLKVCYLLSFFWYF